MGLKSAGLPEFTEKTISPYNEMLAYETLWAESKATLKTIADRFRAHQVLPSQLLRSQGELLPDGDLREKIASFLSKKHGFSVALHGSHQYPSGLRDASHPVELFYYKGDLSLTETRCISVVGTRECSREGSVRANRMARELAQAGYTIVSGLARGIDTAAMTGALSVKGRLIGVIGTPIDHYYPEENKALQDTVARDHLLISQVPFYRYQIESFKAHRTHFPERNQTMSAISEATVIIEASEHSGTLIQARACLEQKRRLFILDSCFKNSSITWPSYYQKRGAVRVSSTEEVLNTLARSPST